VPILSRIAARITDPGVGASTCASGNQVWRGKIGTLIAKARAKAPKSQSSSVRPRGTSRRSTYANDATPKTSWALK